MVVRENDCCGCASPGYPCIGISCELLRVPHFYCDRCGNEDTLYWFEGEQLCIECIKDDLEEVEAE